MRWDLERNMTPFREEELALLNLRATTHITDITERERDKLTHMLNSHVLNITLSNSQSSSVLDPKFVALGLWLYKYASSVFPMFLHIFQGFLCTPWPGVQTQTESSTHQEDSSPLSLYNPVQKSYRYIYYVYSCKKHGLHRKYIWFHGLYGLIYFLKKTRSKETNLVDNRLFSQWLPGRATH